MDKEFLSLLDSSNSIKNNSTDEITITNPNLNFSDMILRISSSCQITSNCNTKIICQKLEINSPNVFLSNITLDCIVNISESTNVSLTNIIFKPTSTPEYVLSISSNSDASLDNVNISGESEIGILILDHSNVKINNLEILDSTNSLIGMRENSNLTIQKSTLRDTISDCIDAGKQCKVEIFECNFLNVGHSAFLISDTTFILKDSTIDKCGKNDVVIDKVNQFLIENNSFHEGEISCISINQSEGVIRNNKFHKFKGNGVLCSLSSNVQILNNEFFDLLFPSIGIRTKSRAVIAGNKIVKNEVNGISIRDASDVLVKECVIEDIVECGISISDSEKVDVLNNKFSNCKVTAIESYNKSAAFVRMNEISNIGKYAFLAYTSGYIEADNNEICDVKIAMAKINFKGTGIFTNNKIDKCPVQCECQTSSFFLFNGNGSFEGLTNDLQKSKDLSIKFEEMKFDSNSSKMCLKCHNKPHNCYLVDCGHNVYCKECADQALKNKEICPVCRWPIIDVSVGFDTSSDDKCIICLENVANCIILPCGHIGVCSDCVENWFKTKKTCPICRKESCFYKEIINNKI